MKIRISRRNFNQVLVSGTIFGAFTQFSTKESLQAQAQPMSSTSNADIQRYDVSLTVNGKRVRKNLDSRVTLLDLLREELNLTGTKKGCDQGHCGACTVIVNGRRIKSCLSLALMHEDDEVLTIEGVADGDRLHSMQQAFIKHDSFQCGFCTPGQIMSAIALLKEPCGRNDIDVKECMSGNVCRCGAYANIVAAIQEVRQGGGS